MDYFAGLDISMDETHVCVLDREGVVVRESKTASMTIPGVGGRGRAAHLSRRAASRSSFPDVARRLTIDI